MSDTISRQVAIDAADKIIERDTSGNNDVVNAMIAWSEYIRQLPSAQPEIIRCKDCKHHWTHKCMDSMPIERCDLEQTFYDAEYDFCSLAERREATE